MIKKIVVSSLFLIFIIISAFISTPIPFLKIPFTLQVFSIFLTASILPFKYTFLTIFSYIILGLIGLPIFANGKSGFEALASPGGGFIIGFLFSGIVINITIKMFDSLKLRILISNFLGLVTLYIFGSIGFVIITKLPFKIALIQFTPFMIIDLVKINLVFLTVRVIKKYLINYLNIKI